MDLNLSPREVARWTVREVFEASAYYDIKRLVENLPAGAPKP